MHNKYYFPMPCPYTSIADQADLPIPSLRTESHFSLGIDIALITFSTLDARKTINKEQVMVIPPLNMSGLKDLSLPCY